MFNYRTYFVPQIAGVGYSGTTIPLDVSFGGKSLVTSSVSVGLDINQDAPLGTYPTGGFSVTGYLIGPTGAPLTAPVPLSLLGRMPAQIWPGWPYYLPDGTPYLPATTLFETWFEGNRHDICDWQYFVDPVVFTGIHFDITTPSADSVDVLGCRVGLSNFEFPIYVSPEPVPEFRVSVPDSCSTWFLFVFGVVVLWATRRMFQMIRSQGAPYHLP